MIAHEKTITDRTIAPDDDNKSTRFRQTLTYSAYHHVHVFEFESYVDRRTKTHNGQQQ